MSVMNSRENDSVRPLYIFRKILLISHLVFRNFESPLISRLFEVPRSKSEFDLQFINGESSPNVS
jgi:hypothetical protein